MAVAVEYSGTTPQPLFAMGQAAGISAILREQIRPRIAYCAVLPEALGRRVTPHRSSVYEMGEVTVYYRLDQQGRVLMGGRAKALVEVRWKA